MIQGRYRVLFGFVIGAVMSVVLLGSTVAAEACPEKNLLGFPGWYNGLQCEKGDDTMGNDIYAVKMDKATDIWIIVMNAVQWIILATGYVALYFIIWSGFKYITSGGDPQNVKTAKDTLRYAIIGLVAALAAVAIVRTVQASISGVVT